MIWIVFGTAALSLLTVYILFIAETKKDIIIGSLVCIIIWVIMSSTISLQVSTSVDVWNNGFCECGTHWELVGVSHSRTNGTVKYYSCSECYNEIEINGQR